MKKSNFIVILTALFFIGCKDNSVIETEQGTDSITADAELYAQVTQPVGNIAYKNNGDLVFSNHPFFNPDIRVVQYDSRSKTTSPFPNLDWNTQKNSNENYLSTVLGIRSDSKGVVWMLDMGFRNHITPKFVGWNTVTGALENVLPIPSPHSLPTSQLNDFVINEKDGVFIIADEDIGPGGDGSKGALIIVDIVTGKARRVLQGHYSTVPDKTSPLIFNGQPLTANGSKTPIMVGADCITADKNNEWLYYAPLNGKKLYRILMRDLLNTSLDDTQLGSRVQRYADKENNGSASMDEADNIYMTYLESNSIGVILAGSKKMYRYVTHEDMLWPDGASTNKDGYLYVPATQLNLGAAFNNGVDKTKTPYRIFRFKPLAKGIFGR